MLHLRYMMAKSQWLNIAFFFFFFNITSATLTPNSSRFNLYKPWCRWLLVDVCNLFTGFEQTFEESKSEKIFHPFSWKLEVDNCVRVNCLLIRLRSLHIRLDFFFFFVNVGNQCSPACMVNLLSYIQPFHFFINLVCCHKQHILFGPDNRYWIFFSDLFFCFCATV